ncbi:uncharacterized protein [Rutidosis leptorrhynchoides]|uniref:uncharacterized protein n=1 Tax=Rutidosis leptorrhynchoides TaxID=125765 RepID=UPI003A993655
MHVQLYKKCFKINGFLKRLGFFVWRALRRRLPMLLELDKRGIDLHSVGCLLCNDDIESVDHSLSTCKDVLEAWCKMFDWWGFGGMSNDNIVELLKGNVWQINSDVRKNIWQAVTWTCAYLIWKNRNQKFLKSKSWNVLIASSEIQVKSFESIAKRCKQKSID